MCGCMLMHAAMDHGEHAPTGASAAPGVNAAACPHCGFALAPGYAYCPNCGAKLGSSKCPACGQKVEASWTTCAYCGSPLGEVQGQFAKA